jgi:hypothetical protein
MWSSARRISAARSWQLARAAFASLVAERDALLEQVYWLQEQLREITAELRELKVAVLARQNAEAVLAGLQRQRDIERAQATERAPDTLLQ